MIRNIYSVYDSKTEAYLDPFFARSHGEALRNFEQAVSTTDHPFQKHSKDFSLVHIGTFDDVKGIIEPLLLPNVLESGLNISSRQANAA